jgi:hypothetical protein
MRDMRSAADSVVMCKAAGEGLPYIRELCCMEGFANRDLGADRRNARKAYGFLGWVIAGSICVYRERPKHQGPAGLGVMILP